MERGDYELSVALFNVNEVMGKLNSFIKREQDTKERQLIRAMQLVFPVDRHTETEAFHRGQSLRKKFNPHL